MNKKHTCLKGGKIVWLTLVLFIFAYPFGYAQTTSNTVNPDWTDNSDWTGSAPFDGSETTEDAILAHNSNISFDLVIFDQITVNAGVTLSTDKKITIDNGGTLIINGLVVLTDEVFTIKDGGSLIVNGELRGTDSSKEFKLEKGNLYVSSVGKINWAGFWNSNDNPATATIDGLVNVGGDLNNKITIDGDGAIDIGGILNNDGGSIFGCTDPGNACCTGSGCSLLPIELLSFTAQSDGNVISLEWLTGAEVNNDFFTIERSTDAINYELVTTLSGSGTTNTLTTYTFTDVNAYSGRSYYRLSQTDFDGTKETFPPIVVNMNNAPSKDFSIYPNPASGQDVLNIRLSSNDEFYNQPVTLVIRDLVGQEFVNVQSNNDRNIITQQINDLNTGIYLVSLEIAGNSFMKKLVIE
ncbi:MAG: T9SS type A sorting domain-containing protein [Bacteroidota bacterium]